MNSAPTPGFDVGHVPCNVDDAAGDFVTEHNGLADNRRTDTTMSPVMQIRSTDTSELDTNPHRTRHELRLRYVLDSKIVDTAGQRLSRELAFKGEMQRFHSTRERPRRDFAQNHIFEMVGSPVLFQTCL